MVDQLTPQQIEALATPSDDSASADAPDPMDAAAYFGNPNIQGSKGRTESASSNNQAAMLGPSLVRGAVAGTIGLPGDLESAFRHLESFYHGTQPSDNVLPTTSDLNDSLPGKTDGGMNSFATGVGNFVGPAVSGDAVKGGSAFAKYLAPALGDALDATHTALGGKAFAWSDAPNMKGNFAGWPGLQRGALLGQEYSNTGASLPLNLYLDDLGDGMGFVRPAIDDMVGRQARTGFEHGSEIALDHNTLDEIPFNAGNDKSVTTNVLKNLDGGSLLNIHTHPGSTLALPSFKGMAASNPASPGDIGHYNWRAGQVAPNESITGLIVNSRKPGTLDYSSRTIPGQSDLLSPSYFDPVVQSIRDAVSKGAFDPAIRDAMDQSRILPEKSEEARSVGKDVLDMSSGHLPMAYFDAKGMSRSAHDLSSSPYIAALLRHAWPIAKDVVGNTPGYAVGGSIDAPATVGLATFAGQNGGPTGATSSSSGGQTGDPTGYMNSAPAAAAPAGPSVGNSAIMGAAAPGTSTGNFAVQFNPDGSLVNNTTSATPTYNDPYTTFMGMKYLPPGAQVDPALSMTLNAGNAGNMKYGVAAFLHPQDSTGFAGPLDANVFSTDDMMQLAKNMGIDVSSANGDNGQIQGILNNKLSNYSSISGMSEGWNPTGNARGSNAVLYKSENGKLIPIQQGANYNAPTSGGWLAQHEGILAPLAVASGGLAYGALAGEGASAAGAGAAGAGAGAEASGIGSAWASLSPIEQAAITGAGKGALTSALTGGNVLRGAALGGFTGGAGAWAGPAISGALGVPGYVGSAIGSAGIGGATAAAIGGNPVTGALTSGLTSLGTTGLSDLGVPSDLAGNLSSRLIKYFTTPGSKTPVSTPAQAHAVAATPTVDTPQPSYADLGSYFTTPAKRP